jgi:NADH dehydrogenase [ubiquinone] 1 alpha subcomplex assembly factor 5
MAELFDMRLRALRRDRAARLGVELFLLERAFADCLERLELANRIFERALLIGCPDPQWPERLGRFAHRVEALDAGPLFAAAAQGQVVLEDHWQPSPAAHALVLAVGTLDTVNDLPAALRAIASSLARNSLFLGAMRGGESLPRLRGAMRAADGEEGAASAHVHPRIEAPALAPLLTAAGFANPVVDVDRVRASYETLDRLVADLRRMGATNILAQRSRRPLSRRALEAARSAFAADQEDGRTVEIFELLHFAGWTPAERMTGR